ncbi:GNAT family N-acetyltransferase [Cryobacterium tepidiphilum]|uniref:GNAT family N-acetyltransferase n=1 Tax=Cryobacterium tepidiphilum TaxID=2486026 RepID=A0A3M8KW82_9MICO|nr:GNAT family N-acetyltransferase [Cryobacterium tepidiphilum]RNE56634.1 GNAT family N-acetyltransferase [Cryobacterium tepidiphilum]
MSVSVRQAGPADAAALAPVAADTFALACPPGTGPRSIADFIARHLSQERFEGYLADSERDIRLAFDGDEAAGYTMLVFGEPHAPEVAAAITHRPTVELSKVYVLGHHHGAGVAATLMSATLAAARERGATGVWLGVNQHNARALRFYEKSGFAIVGTKTFLVGQELNDDFVMEQAL